MDANLPLGSHIVLLDLSKPHSSSERITNLTPGFAAAGRPDVSFDAKRILFVARRTPDDPFGVWEMNCDGTGLTQIITRTGSCSAAIYLSTLYSIDSDEPVPQIAFCSSGGTAATEQPFDSITPAVATVSSLFTCRPSGRRIRQITFNPYGVSDPCLLSDGRLLYASASAIPESNSARLGATSLFTVNTDGTDVSAFKHPTRSPVQDGMPCETADGWVIHVESRSRGWDQGGSLVAVRRVRSLHTRRVVASAADGLYHSPASLPDGNLLVSYRAGPDDSYGVYVLDPQRGVRTIKIIDSPQWHELNAHVLRPRAVPEGRSSVVDERLQTGLLYCLNTYLSDTDPGTEIAERRISRLRVFRAEVDTSNAIGAYPPTPRNRAETTAAATRSVVTEELLGEVPVESDGSFYLEVPAMTPLRLQTLGADGAVLQSMQSWFWVMPRESRGCIGCHEDHELTPPNRQTLALRRPPRRVGVTDQRHRDPKQEHRSRAETQ
jgi:hypothetical protein